MPLFPNISSFLKPFSFLLYFSFLLQSLTNYTPRLSVTLFYPFPREMKKKKFCKKRRNKNGQNKASKGLIFMLDCRDPIPTFFGATLHLAFSVFPPVFPRKNARCEEESREANLEQSVTEWAYQRWGYHRALRLCHLGPSRVPYNHQQICYS